MSLGHDFFQLEKFITSTRNLLGNSPEKQGLYLRAFSQGLDKVLEDYRKAILEAEQTILREPQMTLLFVVQHFSQVKEGLCDWREKKKRKKKEMRAKGLIFSLVRIVPHAPPAPS